MNQEIYRPTELTGDALNTYSESMPEGENSSEVKSQPATNQLEDQPSNPTNESLVELLHGEEIRELMEQNPGDRASLVERLIKEKGMDTKKAEKIISSIKEGLPAKGTSETVAMASAAAEPTSSAEDIINSIDMTDITDRRLINIVASANKWVKRGEATPRNIQNWINQVEKIANSEDEEASGQASQVMEDLFSAFDAAKNAERQAKADEKATEEAKKVKERYFVSTNHPLLENYADEVNEFIKQSIEGKYSEEEHYRLTQRITAFRPMDTKDDDINVEENDQGAPIRTTVRDLGFTDAQRAEYNEAQAILLAQISEKLSKYRLKTGETEIVEKNAQDLAEWIRLGAEDPEAAMAGIEEFFNNHTKSDMERPTYSMALSQAIDILRANHEIGRVKGEVVAANEANERMAEFAMEYGLERIISIWDNAPTDEYGQFNLYQSDNIDRITQLARVYDEFREKEYGRDYKGIKMFNYLVALKGTRRAMHELFRGMKDPKTYLTMITGYLRKDGLDFVENKIAGVSDNQIIYEKILGAALSESNGWLTDQAFKAADDYALNLMEAFAKTGVLRKESVMKDGTTVARGLRDWEIKRARLMGRSLGAASQRRITYAIIGDIPDYGPKAFKSLESEFIARRAGGLIKLIPDRFFDQGLARRILGILVREQKRNKNTDQVDHKKYGYLDKNGNERGLYGNSQRAFATVDLGTTDPKSNGWRAGLLFLEQKDFQNIPVTRDQHGALVVADSTTPPDRIEKITIGQFLFEMTNKHTPHHGNFTPDNDPINSPDKKTEHPSVDSDAFNEDIADVIGKQRLFLGVLMRQYNLNEATKTVIWKNVATNLPSRIAAFFPNELNEGELGKLGGSAKWKEIRDRVFLAEHMRVKNDERFARTGEGQYKDVDAFFREAGLTERSDINFVRALQGFGRGQAPTLAHMTFPYAAFLDDAPKTDWKELSDEDYDRILVNDQSAFEEGYGHYVGLVADPVLTPEGIGEKFKEMIEKTSSPLGIHAAQDRIEPFINTYLEVRRENESSKWIGTIRKMLRKPRSIIEEYNLQAEIADSPKAQADILRVLAQKDVISDEPGRVDKKPNLFGRITGTGLGRRTQYVRMRDINEAAEKDKLEETLRLLILLFPPEVVLAFLSSGVFDDIEGV